VDVFFEDGSCVRADVVLGADGIRSVSPFLWAGCWMGRGYGWGWKLI